MDRANPEADQRAWDSVLPPGQSLLAIHVKSREFQRAVGDRARLVSILYQPRGDLLLYA
jgi:hypothetical protein